MLGFCDVVLELLGGTRTGARDGARGEVAAIAELYFGQGGLDPPAERLLWWEGIAPADVERERGRLPRMRSSIRERGTARAA